MVLAVLVLPQVVLDTPLLMVAVLDQVVQRAEQRLAPLLELVAVTMAVAVAVLAVVRLPHVVLLVVLAVEQVERFALCGALPDCVEPHPSRLQMLEHLK
jgi:hypothetical protein